MCHPVFMYYGRDKNTNSQINGSIWDAKWNILQLDNDKYVF